MPTFTARDVWGYVNRYGLNAYTQSYFVPGEWKELEDVYPCIEGLMSVTSPIKATAYQANPILVRMDLKIATDSLSPTVSDLEDLWENRYDIDNLQIRAARINEAWDVSEIHHDFVLRGYDMFYDHFARAYPQHASYRCVVDETFGETVRDRFAAGTYNTRVFDITSQRYYATNFPADRLWRFWNYIPPINPYLRRNLMDALEVVFEQPDVNREILYSFRDSTVTLFNEYEAALLTAPDNLPLYTWTKGQ